MNTWNPNANELFLKALEIQSDKDRVAFLSESCGDDTSLRAEVEGLLQANAQAGGFLEPQTVSRFDCDVGAEQPGAVIGPYKLIESIGEGGMGTVWIAERDHPKQRVALKLIKSGMDSKQVIRRFDAERQALALMSHNNIAKMLDAGTTESGRPYFVMELVKGVSITKYCDETHTSVQERLKLFIPVCQAVQHAHQKGIIHRDIKPSNVLVCIEDGRPVPKIIDFGVAKALHQPLTEGTLHTAFHQVVGTLEYMSPEQAELNALDVDTRADIYALGVLLFELLTGSTPITRDELKKVALVGMLRKLKELEPKKPSTRLSESKETIASVAALRRTDPSKLLKEVQGDLDWIVIKCLEADRTRRYETATAVCRDVERHLANEPLEAGPPTLRYRFRKFLRRHKSGVLAALSVAGVLLAGLVTSLWQMDRALFAEDLAMNNEEAARRNERLANDRLAIAQAEERRANEQAGLAKKERERTQSLLIRQYSSNAARLIEEGDAAGALLWTAEALREHDQDVGREQIHRIQFSELLRRLPRPVGKWEGAYQPNLTQSDFTSDEKTVLIPQRTGAVLINLENNQSYPQVPAPQGTELDQAILTPDGLNVVGLFRRAYNTPFMDHPVSVGLEFSLASIGVFWEKLPTIYSSSLMTLQIWNAKTGQLVSPPRVLYVPSHHEFRQLQMGPTGKYYLIGGNVYDTLTGKRIVSLVNDTTRLHHICINRGGSKILVWSMGKNIAQVWNMESTRWDKPACKLPGYARLASFDDSGRALVVVIQSDNPATSSMEVWDILTGARIAGPFVNENQLGFNASFLQVRFNRDCTRLLALGGDGSVHVWDLASQKRIFMYKEAQESTTFVDFGQSKRGLLVTCGAKGTIRLWNVNDGSQVSAPWLHHDRVDFASFTESDHQLVIASKDGSVDIHEIISKGIVNLGSTRSSIRARQFYRFEFAGRLRHDSAVQRSELSPNGRFILTQSSTSDTSTEFALWDLATEQYHVQDLRVDRRYLGAATFSEDARSLVIDHNGESLQYFDTTTMRPLLPAVSLPKHVLIKAHIILSPDKRHCLFISGWDPQTNGYSLISDSLFALLDSGTGRLTQLGPKAVTCGIKDACFSPNGAYVAALSYRDLDGSHPVQRFVEIWDTATGQLLASPAIEGQQGPEVLRPFFSRVFFTNDSQQLWVIPRTEATPIRCFRVKDGTPLPSVGKIESDLLSVDRRRQMVVSGTRTLTSPGTTKVWEYRNLDKPLWQLQFGANHVCFSDDGARLATSSGGSQQLLGEARVWDTRTGTPITAVMRHSRPVKMAVFCDQGRVLVTVTENGMVDVQRPLAQVHVWDAERGSRIIPPINLDGSVLDIGRDKTDESVLAVTSQGELMQWKGQPILTDGQELWKVAQYISGMRIDQGGSIVPLTLTEHQKLISEVAPQHLSTTSGSLPALRNWLLRSILRRSDDKDNIQTLTRLIELEPEEIRHRMKRAALLIKSEELAHALDDLNWIVSRDPGNAESRYQRGVLLAHRLAKAAWDQNRSRALEYVDRGLDDLTASTGQYIPSLVETNFLNELIRRIAIESTAGSRRWQSLPSVQETCCQVNESHPTLNTLALVYLRCGRYDEALATLDKCSKIHNRTRPSRQALPFANSLLGLGSCWSLPFASAWWQYHPADLIVLAMVQHQTHRLESYSQTKRLLGYSLLNPKFKNDPEITSLLQEFLRMESSGPN
jgi:serine/threonine protein kinase/WD40 repeat protein/tetratricopeptide (TPR) repeat protein